ncbi:MAG: ABC transporter permease [Chloroflexi bacterium]|nr:ABC transporter permease [Chloroflexota bacterium]MBV6437407.1 Dipeptide transport system permease protein DppB [Anaerolineae bacterium]MDL1914671.1 ABC transporter permease [Anaerolineae bacterium CFX4]OQY81496.1 MAG: peptide ABC transporter permease [Anaerolineae bacterium UTCFX5]MBW7879110.1 ABC transporter permease [Anaerolineae bacterium]
MRGYRNYFLKKIVWFIVTLTVAFTLNFILPRLMPGDPVAAIAARMAQGMSNATGVQAVYEQYTELFGTDKPIPEQFVIYLRNVLRGDFGYSISQYPRTVGDVISSSIGWTLMLQLPAILVGWILGNLLGALAAYIRKGFDRVLMPASLFLSNLPAFGMAVILLVIFAVNLKWFPTSGGYDYAMVPSASWEFMWSVIVHYQLPFWSIVLITIGGQAIGMRSMAIYELNADYVKYARFLGVKDSKIIRYVFRNAMLPQITGLALSIGTMVSGALVAEIIFSYPGLGNTILTAVRGGDYPLISATTLIITWMVLLAFFSLEILYGLIDPRIKAAQSE